MITRRFASGCTIQSRRALPCRGWVRAALGLLALVTVFAWTRSAEAYAWMIRHDYAGCNQCHADPSGGGLLTAYGRAQGEILLRAHYGKTQEDDDPGKTGDFLLGALPLPEALLLGGDARLLYLSSKPEGAPSTNRFILMQTDLEGQVTVDRARANASIGYAREGALAAAITHGINDRLVSRTHWVGFDLGADRQYLVRAGRMNIPFGVRSIEHTMWVRNATRTDINAAQQHGVALAYNGESLRGEAMFIAGNFQLGPPSFRERGYSGYLEVVPTAKMGLGISSLVAHADRDLFLQTPIWRQAHGVFGRYSPFTSLVLLTEADLLVESQPPAATAAATALVGYAAMFQADFEPIQGVHIMGTGELLDRKSTRDGLSYGAWGTAAWFFAPHADLRADANLRSIASGSSRVAVTSFLLQMHIYL